MKTRMNLGNGRWTLAAGSLAILWACGGEAASAPTTTSSAATETEVSVDSNADAGCTELTVKNYDKWCKVSVAGGDYSKAAEQKVCVAPGTITLDAKIASSEFELGPDPWYDTTTPGVTKGKVSSATIDVKKKAACVWACCPFTGGSGCPSTDQCP